MSFLSQKVFFRIEHLLFILAIVCITLGLWGMRQEVHISLALPFRPPHPTVFQANVYIDDILVSGKTPNDALLLLETKSKKNQPMATSAGNVKKYVLFVDKVSVASTSSELKIARNNESVVQQAFSDTTKNSSSWLSSFSLFSPQPKKYYSQVVFDQQAVEKMTQELKKKVDQPGRSPKATLALSGNVNSLKIDPGKPGFEVNTEATIQKFAHIIPQEQASTSAVIATTSAVLTSEETQISLERAKKYVGKKIVFTKEGLDQVLNDQKIISFLTLPNGFSEETIYSVLTQWQKEVNTEPKDAILNYDPETLQVKEFQAPRKGRILDKEKTKALLLQSLEEIEKNSDPAKKEWSYPLPVEEKNPTKTLGETNTLGIQERIGLGESEYEHSIPGRIHNVSLTADRINNTIVKAGAEFSFNKTLGEVSAATGFAPAYVIRNGRTELGDGGGVCQVSTTLFRSLLNAGLPITKRYAHSYRVSYYELNAKPGIDATVYAGDVDLRFKNDTGHALLIHTETFPKSLYMFVEIYGTSDGRTTEIVDHKTWDFIPAPPPLYQDDPSLPRGVIKQVDFAASGIKASFKNIVKDKNGNIIREDTYFSNYKPWRAIFLRGIS